VRERIVGSSSPGREVSSTKRVWPGGSSSVLSSALAAPALISSARRTMTMRSRASCGAKLIFSSTTRRIWSTEMSVFSSVERPRTSFG